MLGKPCLFLWRRTASGDHMDATEFIRMTLRDLHSGFRSEIETLSEAQMLATPAEGANTISFLLWHFVRTEDKVLHRHVGRASIWETGSWAARLGDKEGQGTGFTYEQVRAVAPRKDELLAYAGMVWEEVPALISSLAPALDEVDPERPSQTVARTIASVVVGHGFWHLGDIRFTKGLMGMPFAR